MKILVVGSGPWPLELGAVVTGPSIRLRQFVEPLLKAKHDVGVILLEEERRSSVPIRGVFGAEGFTPDQILDPEYLRKSIECQFVDAVFGVGSLMPAAAACRLASLLDVACWVDFFGDPMAELHAAQLRQGGAPDTTARDHIWKFVREGLLRGDAFSSVSAPQRHAILGQVGLLGRYGIDWEVCRRVHEIPCAVPAKWTESVELPEFPGILRDYGMEEGARYVFFGGSWNVWLDEVTMGRALAIALRDDPALRFVCAGIPTGPAGKQIHASLFKSLSEFADTGRLVDIPPGTPVEESALLAHAGACLSLDRAIPEAEMGSRNRLMAMVRWGARPVVSMEAGIETLLVAEGLAAGIAAGNADRAAREILSACARTPTQREADRAAGLDWLRSITFDRTLEPAIHWLAANAPRWPAMPGEGMLDRWSAFPADPAKLFEGPPQKKGWFFR